MLHCVNRYRLQLCCSILRGPAAHGGTVCLQASFSCSCPVTSMHFHLQDEIIEQNKCIMPARAVALASQYLHAWSLLCDVLRTRLSTRTVPASSRARLRPSLHQAAAMPLAKRQPPSRQQVCFALSYHHYTLRGRPVLI